MLLVLLACAPTPDISSEAPVASLRTYATTDPWLTSPAWTLTGATAGLRVGDADLDSIGDVNGDGYDDVVVSAPSAGRVWLYLGNASGVAPRSSRTLFGPGGARFGASVSGGDFDHDGYADVAVGAPAYSGAHTGEGAVYLYRGGPRGLSSTPAWVRPGGQDGAAFGTSVRLHDDSDHDGDTELVVTAPGWSDGEAGEGAAFVWYGQFRTLPGAPYAILEADQVGAGLSTARFAASLGGTGSLDLLMGAPGWDGPRGIDSGKVWTMQSMGSGLTTLHTRMIEGDAGLQRLGRHLGRVGPVHYWGVDDVAIDAGIYEGSSKGTMLPQGWDVPLPTAAGADVSLTGVGDINGDGVDDVVAAWPAAGGGAGGAWLFEGSDEDWPEATAAWSLAGAPGDALGTAVVALGDVNADGWGDFLVTLPGLSGGAAAGGGALVYLGAPDEPVSTRIWATSGAGGAEFGAAVAGLGDVDGDGLDDILVGAPGADSNLGEVSLYSGSSSGPVETWSAGGDSTWAGLGRAVAAAGDVNDDGYADLLVGDMPPTYYIADGRAAVWLGGPSGPAATADWTAEPAALGMGGFASVLAGVGDMDGDGYDDIVVGDPYGDASGSGPGVVYGYAGGSAGPVAAASWSLSPEDAGDGFGSALAAAGDVNGDGLADLVIGSSNLLETETCQGQVDLVLGDPAGPGGVAWTRTGTERYGYLGEAVVGVGDADGDGYDDFVSSSAYTSELSVGELAWYPGSADPASISAAWTYRPDGGYRGGKRLTACDLDGDGALDLVAAYQEGTARVDVYTALSMPPADEAWSVEGGDGTNYWGARVGCAGDTDGDGRQELLIGAPENGRTTAAGGAELWAIFAP